METLWRSEESLARLWDLQGSKAEKLGAIRGGFLEEERFKLRLRRSRAIGRAEGNESTEF